jgi:1-phosphofructokinase/tagatose 6-phosphate kinase
MILTVTLNAALDRTLAVPNFSVGHQHRAIDSLLLPGGKGVNVARSLKRLGIPVIATGLAGGRTGTAITEELTAEGILNDFVRIQGESRTSTAVVEPTINVQTEINEYGPMVQDAELETFFEKLHYLSKGTSRVVLCGSLPRGLRPEVYADIIRRLRALGRPTVIDAPGETLHLALAAEPELVSPNVREAEDVVGYEFTDEADLATAVAALTQMGAQNAIVHSHDGCIARVRGERGELVTLRARFNEPIDAGFLSQWGDGQPIDLALKTAVACGMANTRTIGAGVFDLGDVEAYARQVVVTKVEAE